MSIMPKITNKYAQKAIENSRYTRYAKLISECISGRDLRDIDSIPIEGMFRLLEMYKYDSFFTGFRVDKRAKPFDWHYDIELALDLASLLVYKSKTAAIEELQLALHVLASKKLLTKESSNDVIRFFDLFIKNTP